MGRKPGGSGCVPPPCRLYFKGGGGDSPLGVPHQTAGGSCALLGEAGPLWGGSRTPLGVPVPHGEVPAPFWVSHFTPLGGGSHTPWGRGGVCTPLGVAMLHGRGPTARHEEPITLWGSPHLMGGGVSYPSGGPTAHRGLHGGAPPPYFKAPPTPLRPPSALYRAQLCLLPHRSLTPTSPPSLETGGGGGGWNWGGLHGCYFPLDAI